MKHGSSRLQSFIVLCAVTLTAQTVCLVPQTALAKPQSTATYEQERLVSTLLHDAVDLMRKQQFRQAESVLKRAAACDVSNESAKVHTELAYIYLKFDDWKNCSIESSKALEFDPEPSIGYLVGAGYGAQGRGAEAVSMIRRHGKTRGQKWLQEANVALSEGMCELAQSLIKVEKNDQARTLMELAVSLQDSSPHLHYWLAVAYLETGEPEDAIVQAKKVVKLDPSLSVSFVLGYSYMCVGDYDQAISLFSERLAKTTDAKNRRDLEDLLQDLRDDKAKVRPGRPSTVDYFDEMKAQDHVFMWPKDRFPLRVFFQPASGVKGYRPTLKRIFLQSLDEWCEASDKLAFKVVKEANDADLVVVWTDRALPYGSGRKGKEAAGLTHFERMTSEGISKVRIELETYNNDRKEKRSNQSMRSTILHELGHALGLGHSGYVRDVMFYSSNQKRLLCLSYRDKSTIQRYYKDHPAIEHTKLAVKGRDQEVLPDECFVEPTPSLQSRYPETVAMMLFDPATSRSSARSRAKKLEGFFITPTPPAKPPNQGTSQTPATKSQTDLLFATPVKPNSTATARPKGKAELFCTPNTPTRKKNK